MTPSARCEALIKSFETCARAIPDSSGQFAAYLPTDDDVPTIGWGTAGKDIHLGMIWTQAQCDARFERDLADFSAAINSMLGGAPTTQGQFDALTSFAYNEGAHALATSALLRKHRAGDFAGAKAQFARWDLQDGKVLNGLVRRRAVEAEMYLP